MRSPAANRTMSMINPIYMANDSMKKTVLVQFQLAMVPFSASRYNGPTAMHSASQRHASTARVQHAMAPTRAIRGWARRVAGFVMAGDVMIAMVAG